MWTSCMKIYGLQRFINPIPLESWSKFQVQNLKALAGLEADLV